MSYAGLFGQYSAAVAAAARDRRSLMPCAHRALALVRLLAVAEKGGRRVGALLAGGVAARVLWRQATRGKGAAELGCGRARRALRCLRRVAHRPMALPQRGAFSLART